MIVVDTSALLGAWYMHYLPDSMPGFWTWFDEAWEDGRLVISSVVYDELTEQSEAARVWVHERRSRVVVPSEEVQGVVGDLMDRFRFAEGRDGADPFVIAEARVRSFGVATYEGKSPTGSTAKPKKNVDNIPTICRALDVQCWPPGEAWREAGLSL